MKKRFRKLHYVNKLIQNYNKSHPIRQLKIITYSFDTDIVWICDNLGTSGSRIDISRGKKEIKEQFKYV